MATQSPPRPKFRSGCALTIRTYDVRFRDGSSAIIRCDASVLPRMLSGEVAGYTVRGR